MAGFLTTRTFSPPSLESAQPIASVANSAKLARVKHLFIETVGRMGVPSSTEGRYPLLHSLSKAEAITMRWISLVPS